MPAGRTLATRWSGPITRPARPAGAVETATREAAAASAAAVNAEAAVAPLREEAQIAGAVLQRVTLENDRMEREAQAAAAEMERLTTDLACLDADRAREAQIIDDAGEALTRLTKEIAERWSARPSAAPERLPQLEQAWRAADAERAAREGEVEALASGLAARDAERRAAETRTTEAREPPGAHPAGAGPGQGRPRRRWVRKPIPRPPRPRPASTRRWPPCAKPARRWRPPKQRARPPPPPRSPPATPPAGPRTSSAG